MIPSHLKKTNVKYILKQHEQCLELFNINIILERELKEKSLI